MGKNAYVTIEIELKSKVFPTRHAPPLKSQLGGQEKPYCFVNKAGLQLLAGHNGCGMHRLTQLAISRHLRDVASEPDSPSIGRFINA